MKHTIQRDESFRPFTVSLTFETHEELEGFWSLSITKPCDLSPSLSQKHRARVAVALEGLAVLKEALYAEIHRD